MALALQICSGGCLIELQTLCLAVTLLGLGSKQEVQGYRVFVLRSTGPQDLLAAVYLHPQALDHYGTLAKTKQVRVCARVGASICKTRGEASKSN